MFGGAYHGPRSSARCSPARSTRVPTRPPSCPRGGRPRSWTAAPRNVRSPRGRPAQGGGTPPSTRCASCRSRRGAAPPSCTAARPRTSGDRRSRARGTRRPRCPTPRFEDRRRGAIERARPSPPRSPRAPPPPPSPPRRRRRPAPSPAVREAGVVGVRILRARTDPAAPIGAAGGVDYGISRPEVRYRPAPDIVHRLADAGVARHVGVPRVGVERVAGALKRHVPQPAVELGALERHHRAAVCRPARRRSRRGAAPHSSRRRPARRHHHVRRRRPRRCSRRAPCSLGR